MRARVLAVGFAALVLWALGAVVTYKIGYDRGHRVGLFDGQWECSQQHK